MTAPFSTAALSVNINQVATLRQSRQALEPRPPEAARIVEAAGAAGVTVHLREDRRHVQEDDLPLLRQAIRGKFNLEIGGTVSMLDVAERCRPNQVTFVGERPDETTIAGALDLKNHSRRVQRAANTLAAASISISLFLDPDPEQIDAATQLGNVRAVELNTASYVHAAKAGDADEARDHLAQLEAAAAQAASNDFEVYAGHGLDYETVGPVAELPRIAELSIGQAIVARALVVGLDGAVREMIEAIRAR